MLGLLFGIAFFACTGGLLLLLSFTTAAEVVGVAAALLLLIFVARWIWRCRKNRPGKAPVGELSPDERIKARAKLVRPKQPMEFHRGGRATSS